MRQEGANLEQKVKVQAQIPKPLHTALKSIAEQSGFSINDLLISAIRTMIPRWHREITEAALEK